MRPADDFFEWLWPATRWVFTEVLYLEALLSRTGVVTPAWEDFPVDDSLEGDALVADYFAFVEAHAGMSDDEVSFEIIARETISPTELLEQMVDQAAEAIKSESDVIETADPVFIEYEPGLEHDPELLVAVLSRGIADWMCSAHEDPPGGDESFDFAVDLVWVFLGFGVFAANCALRTKRLQGGPFFESGAQRFGALGQLELTYCLALYLELLGLDDREALPHLQPNPRGWLADARKDLRTRHARHLAELRALAAPGDGPYRA